MKKLTKEEFETLKTEWYQKLKDDGFQDIEYNETTLNETTSATRFGKMSRAHGGWQAKLEYTQMAESFLEDHEFENTITKVIWEYHANGLSVRKIAMILSETGIKFYKKSQVHNIVKKLKMEMFLKYLVKGSTDVH